MSRILVLYASHHGQTLTIARRIAQRLRADDHDVQVIDASLGLHALPLPYGYDLVVLGSSVQFGKHVRSIEAYIRAHRAQLSLLQTAFFSVSMSAGQANADADPNGYLAQTFARLAWRPDLQIAIAGALRYPRYNWVLRHVMKAIARRAGHPTDITREHVLTDDAVVDAFAAKLCARLEHAPVVARA